MEKVSEEDLDEMIETATRCADDWKEIDEAFAEMGDTGESGECYLRKKVSALSELRELRKVMGAVQAMLQNPGECHIDLEFERDHYFCAALTYDQDHHTDARGATLESVIIACAEKMAALVKGGEG